MSLKFKKIDTIYELERLFKKYEIGLKYEIICIQTEFINTYRLAFHNFLMYFLFFGNWQLLGTIQIDLQKKV